MIDINSYFKAIKVTWIQRLMNSDSNWSVIGNHLISQFGEEIYFSESLLAIGY